MKYRCKICGEAVDHKNMRDHLAGHSPHAENIEWEEVRDEFEVIIGWDKPKMDKSKKYPVAITASTLPQKILHNGIAASAVFYGGREEELTQETLLELVTEARQWADTMEKLAKQLPE